MSEEEKKAITNLIDQVKFWKKNNIKNSNDEILLHLIDKQQKEIEELKETVEFVTSHYISKDKIRNLLRQVNASLYHFKDSEKNNIVQRVKDKLDQLLEE